MAAALKAEAVAQVVDRVLELIVVKGDQLAAAVAEHVVMVVLVGFLRPLVADDPIARVDADDQIQILQEFKCPVDARAPHRASLLQGGFDLSDTHGAALVGQQIDQSLACRPAIVPRAPHRSA